MYRLITLLFAAMMTLAAHADFIKGTVTDSLGKPLHHATITITDLNKTATSDLKGYYVLKNIPAGKHTVKISYIGYGAQEEEVNVSDWTTVDFKLQQQDVCLTDVFVTPNGESMAQFILNKVVENAKPLKERVSSYSSTNSCRIDSNTDFTYLPKSVIKILNFSMGLLGYKKIMQTIENHKELKVEILRDVTFSNGKMQGGERYLGDYYPEELTADEKDAFVSKNWKLDSNIYDEVNDQLKNYKKLMDKNFKKAAKNGIEKDSVFNYVGSYEEDGHTIYCLQGFGTKIEVVDGLWQVRRIIVEVKHTTNYMEYTEAAPGLFLPSSYYDQTTIPFDDMYSKEEIEKARNVDTTGMDEKKAEKKMAEGEKHAAEMEKYNSIPDWSLRKSMAYSYSNIKLVEGN